MSGLKMIDNLEKKIEKDFIIQCCVCKEYTFDLDKVNVERNYFKMDYEFLHHIKKFYQVSHGYCPRCIPND